MSHHSSKTSHHFSLFGRIKRAALRWCRKSDEAGGTCLVKILLTVRPALSQPASPMLPPNSLSPNVCTLEGMFQRKQKMEWYRNDKIEQVLFPRCSHLSLISNCLVQRALPWPPPHKERRFIPRINHGGFRARFAVIQFRFRKILTSFQFTVL